MAEGSNTTSLSTWRMKGIAVVRILFGLIWAVDAWFKWQPDFINQFTSYLTGALDGQPAAVQAWINFWIRVVQVDPRGFAYLVAIAETLVALGLIFGIFTNLTNLGGVILSLVIWSTAEGFGGPYQPGSTDIGSAIIYVFTFAGLFLANAGLVWGLDRQLTPRLRRLAILASGPSSSRLPVRAKQRSFAAR